MKHELEQKIFYLMDNRVHSAKVLARSCVEFVKDAPIQKQNMFEREGTWYQTCHGVISEDICFATREELLASL